jgi:preflagellin peptidase FlaK
MLTLLTGYKINVAKLEKYNYLYPLEDIGVTESGQTNRKLLIIPKDENRERIVEKILDAARTGRIQNEVWATPGLPMLIFITVGLVLALVIGDIVWMFSGLVLG